MHFSFSSLSLLTPGMQVLTLKSVKWNLYLSDLQTGNNLNVLPRAVEQPVPSFSSLLWTKAAPPAVWWLCLDEPIKKLLMMAFV